MDQIAGLAVSVAVTLAHSSGRSSIAANNVGQSTADPAVPPQTDCRALMQPPASEALAVAARGVNLRLVALEAAIAGEPNPMHPRRDVAVLVELGLAWPEERQRLRQLRTDLHRFVTTARDLLRCCRQLPRHPAIARTEMVLDVQHRARAHDASMRTAFQTVLQTIDQTLQVPAAEPAPVSEALGPVSTVSTACLVVIAAAAAVAFGAGVLPMRFAAPAVVGLSSTALAVRCATGSGLGDSDVDAAVPRRERSMALRSEVATLSELHDASVGIVDAVRESNDDEVGSAIDGLGQVAHRLTAS